jgi:TonB family protein
MKPRVNHRGISVLLGLLLVLVRPGVAQDKADADVEEQLRSEYLGQSLTLRHFYKGDQLKFESDGSLVGSADIGPWTVYGEVLVDGISLGERSLQIRGRRVYLSFDPKTKQLRDILSFLEESKAPNRDELKKYYQGKRVDIEIAFTAPGPGVQDVSSAMRTVFLSPGESVSEIVPDYWRGYLEEVEGQSRSAGDSTERIYSVGAGEASMPRAIYSPNPEFSEEARIAKYQGTLTLALVVDSSGSVRDVAIASPLGMGFDEKAVDSVRTWRFAPGVRNAEPVPVQAMVEVDFRLF